jgi:predicted signal transduction protein with EAL and GGDEF domain
VGKIVDVDGHGRPVRMLGVTQDVTHQREQTHVLEQMAHFDALTGLANRLHLTARLKDSTRIAAMTPASWAWSISTWTASSPSTTGWATMWATSCWCRWPSASKRAALQDCVARLGGDEFVILLNGLESRSHCEACWNASCSAWRPPTSGRGHGPHHGQHGLHPLPEDDADEDTLLRHADQAMYQAKQSGRNCVRAFDSVTERQMRAQQADTLRVREGLERGEFTLYLPPKVDMVRNRLVGVEGLARWHHPTQGVLAPAPSCRWWKALRWTSPLANGCARGHPDHCPVARQGLEVPVSVNISAGHLQQPGSRTG